MTNALNGSLHNPAFEHLNRARIADLAPSTSKFLATSFIDGVVAIIWPFSSATGTLSVLLAEPDIRLRKSKGQVKVTFQGECAREVARTKLGIGDTLRLSLEGAEWVHTGDVVSTPGRKIDWDLCYGRRAVLEISRDSTHLAFIDSEKPEATLNASRIVYEVSTPVCAAEETNRSLSLYYSSPAFSKSHRHSSGSFIDASLDPFAEDDGFVVGKGRKRTKFARHSGNWQLLDDDSGNDDGADPGYDGQDQENIGEGDESTEMYQDGQTLTARLRQGSISRDPEVLDLNPGEDLQLQSPPKEFLPPPETEVFEISSSSSDDIEAEVGSPMSPKHITAPVEQRLMAPPQTPIRRPPRSLQESLGNTRPGAQEWSAMQDTVTPRLHPLPSPGLPLVSPLLQHHGPAAGYFPDFKNTTSELDASGVPLYVDEPANTVEEEQINLDVSLPWTSSEGNAESTLQSYLGNVDVDVQQETGAPTVQSSLENLHGGAIGIAPIPFPLRHLNVSEAEEDDQGQLVTQTGDLESDHTAEDLQISDSRPIELDSSTETAEDEDMYGPSQPRVLEEVQKRTSFDVDTTTPPVNVQPDTSPISEQLALSAQSRQRSLEVSAVDSATDEAMSSPLLLLEQSRDKTLGKRRNSSSYAASFDGASDDHHEDTVIEEESSTPPANGLQSALDGTEAAAIPSEVIEIRQVGGEVTSKGANNYQRSHISLLNDETTTDSILTPTDGVLVNSQEARLVTPTEMLVISQKDSAGIPQHLPTPLNTQQDFMNEDELPSIAQEHTMPPTPQGTQDEEFVSFLPDSAPDALGKDTAIIPDSTPELAREPSPKTRRALQRLSRKSLPSEKVSELSSPYFTARRSGKMLSQPLSSPTRKENVQSKDFLPLSPLPAQKGSTAVIEQYKSADEGIAEVVALPKLVSRPAGLTTPLAYFTPLAIISEHFFQTVDILAVSSTLSTDPQRAKHGPKDFYCFLKLVDYSLEENNVVITQIFRPSKFALPAANRGDVVLLRNVKVQSQKRKCMLLSTESSAWAVFSHPERAYTSASMLGVKNAGPPVEYGPEERSRAIELMQWWDEEGMQRFPHPHEQDRSRATATPEPKSQADAVTIQSPVTRSTARRLANLTGHIENGDEELALSPELPLLSASRRQSDVSIISQNQQSPKRTSTRSRRSESVIHELRDGTTWIDEGMMTRGRRSRKSESLVHELRDGVKWIDE